METKTFTSGPVTTVATFEHKNWAIRIETPPPEDSHLDVWDFHAQRTYDAARDWLLERLRALVDS